MNIKKAISLAAFGFMFVLVDFNLTLDGHTICVTPDFVGWILFYLSYDKLGEYISDKPVLKYLPLIMVILSGAIWVLDIVKPDADIFLLKPLANILSAVFMFLFFGVLENVAEDCGSTRTGSLRMLKYLNLACEIVLSVIGLLAKALDLRLVATLFLVVGLIAIGSAIATMFTLFGLRKEINQAVLD